MIAGWRQWADAGSVSSGLPKYLVKHSKATQIGEIVPDGFYLFQIPGTHDLVRPIVKLEDGFPKSLEVKENEIYFARFGRKGLIIFLGDEPQINVEQYSRAFFDIARQLQVKRIISLGGVYGELPYDRERTISAIYTQPDAKSELESYAVRYSNYHGGASIGSYLARQAVHQKIDYIAFYAFVPNYEFAQSGGSGQSVRIENDFMAWETIMRRIDHMFQLGFNFSDLEAQRKRLLSVIDNKIAELEQNLPRLNIREYLDKLASDFEEMNFYPLDAVWEEELRNLLDNP